MKISWFDQKGIDRLNKCYGQKIDYTKFRTYTNLYLTGDKEHDKSELKHLGKLADALVSNNDQRGGVNIALTKRTKYQDMVTALDICLSHDSLGVIPLNDNIYLFKFDLHTSPYSATRKHPAYFIDNIMIENPPHSIFDDLRPFFSSIKPFWPCLIPFAGMIYFWRKTNKWGVETDSNNYPVNR